MARREVVEGELHRPSRAFGELRELSEEPAHRRQVRRVAVGEVVERQEVVGTDQGLAESGQPVAAGAADLLRQVLQALRQVVVDHPADVRLVDPHAEGDGGDDHRVRRVQEPVLHPGPLGVFHAGVVGEGRQSRLGQGRGHLSAVFCRVT